MPQEFSDDNHFSSNWLCFTSTVSSIFSSQKLSIAIILVHISDDQLHNSNTSCRFGYYYTDNLCAKSEGLQPL